jgi:hypothetical protein
MALELSAVLVVQVQRMHLITQHTITAAAAVHHRGITQAVQVV